MFSFFFFYIFFLAKLAVIITATTAGCLNPCCLINDTTNHQTTRPLMHKGWADTPSDSLTQSLADDVTASIRSERHAQNINKTADWYKAVLMNPRPTA